MAELPPAETINVQEVLDMYLAGEIDLICVLGPTASGKTRYAVQLARQIIRCDVLEEPLQWDTLCGLTAEEQRRRSHFPQEYYGQPHFTPSAGDGPVIARLNRARCAAREAELASVAAFSDRDGNLTRQDIPQALNRMSSMLYILMIQWKGKT